MADVAGLPVVEDEIAGDTIPDAVVVLAPIAPERIVLVAPRDSDQAAPITRVPGSADAER